MRIRFAAVAILTLVSLAGIAGFFIPFSSFSLDVVELNQKKNLSEQNLKILKQVHGLRKDFHELDHKIGALKSQKLAVEKAAGIPVLTDEAQQKLPVIDMRNLDRVMQYVDAMSVLYMKVAGTESEATSVFRWLPVLDPVNNQGVVSAVFGKIADPFTGGAKWHYGLDFAANRETPVVATADGIVASVENLSRWGRRIRIVHGHGFSTVYAHLGTVMTNQGKRVKRGEQIASVGISGITTGPHVHYEIWRWGKPLDPREYIFPHSAFAFADSSGKMP